MAAFVGGLLVCLTPCVYQMIAITVSVFGGQQARSHRTSVTLSAMFVLGIVAMFVPLGLIAGLTGGVFGAVLQNRWVMVGVSAVFLALAASMFGAFELALPSALSNRLLELAALATGGRSRWGW